MKALWVGGLLSVLCWVVPEAAVAVERSAVQREASQWSYTSRKTYADPFNEVEVDVIFTREGGGQWRVPAFWAGGSKWTIRFAAPEPGQYRYHLEASDKTNADLNGQAGTLRVKSYTGENPLLKHGALRVSADGHHFEHADGTPFLWLGDTWWKGLSRRISFDEYKVLVQDRRRKGFNAVQIVAGLYPNEVPFTQLGENEGGYVWEPGYARINPRYFDYADRRIQELVKSGIVPAVVGAWGHFVLMTGTEKMKQHWRYLIARYGAYPVVWFTAGQVSWPYGDNQAAETIRQRQAWLEVNRYIRQTDPYRRMMTSHDAGSEWNQLSSRADMGDEAIDFDMLEPGHFDWQAVPYLIGWVSTSYSKTPRMPVLAGEQFYENHMHMNAVPMQRFGYWTAMLNGAAGYTYGAGGIWEMNNAQENGTDEPYETTTWSEAMHLAGSKQVGIGRSILSGYPWWRFRPHPEWVEPRGTTFVEPHAEWFDPIQRWEEVKGDALFPYAAGISGEVRLIYRPQRVHYFWGASDAGPLVTKLEKDVVYRAVYIDPATGQRTALGRVVRPQLQPLLADSFESRQQSEWQDFDQATQVDQGGLMARDGAWTLATGIAPVVDVLVSVEARGEREAGIVLRSKDAQNGVLAVYAPAAGASAMYPQEPAGIWIYEWKQGKKGPPLGMVHVPRMIGSIRLIAEAHGGSASVMLIAGGKTYRTPAVKVQNRDAGHVGVWAGTVSCQPLWPSDCAIRTKADIGAWVPRDPQVFRHFEVQGIQSLPADGNENLVILDSWKAPAVPVPGDWLLALERS